MQIIKIILFIGITDNHIFLFIYIILFNIGLVIVLIYVITKILYSEENILYPSEIENNIPKIFMVKYIM